MADEHDDFKHLCGWLGVDDIQRALAAAFPTLADAAPHLMASVGADTDPVLLYKAWKSALGKYPEYVAQQIGDCVSHGHAHGNDLLQCVEIGLGQPIEFQETDTEFIYGESRKVSGNLGWADGSYGAAAIKAMTTVGMVSRPMLGTDGTYSGQRAKQWGRTGPPADVEAKAAPFKLGNGAQVSTWDELVAAIKNGYPVTICSGQGFSMTRDNQGFCRGQGHWGHCMFIAGVRFDREGACICQSWGPTTPSGPLDLDQPAFSFWADRKVIEHILGEGDSWALSKTPAFKERDLPPAWKYSSIA